MNKTAVTCSAYLLLCVLVIGANYLFLAPVTDPAFRIGLSIAAGIVLTLALVSVWGLLRGYGSGSSSRSAILKRARTDATPTDGHLTVAAGTVRCLGHPLISPISGVTCAAYLYNMFFYTRDARGHRNKVPVYWGYACAPLSIDSAAARYRILAAPELSIPSIEYNDEESIARARSFVTATQFEEADRNTLGAVQTAFTLVGQFFSNQTGEVRKDWTRREDARDPKDLRLEETVLPADTQATVIGTWSTEQNAFVPKKAETGNLGVSIILGPPEKLTTGHGLPAPFTQYIINTILLTAIGLGILYFGHYHWPK